jgi:hypothetical protein
MYQLLAKLCGLVLAMVVVLVVVLDNVNPMESTPDAVIAEAGSGSQSASDRADALAAEQERAAADARDSGAVAQPIQPQGSSQPRLADIDSAPSYQGTLPEPAVQFDDASEEADNDDAGSASASADTSQDL